MTSERQHANGRDLTALREILPALDGCVRHVVLHDSENLELLVDDEGACARSLAGFGADIPRIRHVGDRTLDERWQRTILEKRVRGADGVCRPDAENAFYAFVYRVTLQKFILAPDDREKVAALARAAGIPVRGMDDAFAALETFLDRHGYRCERPDDPAVFFDDELPRWRQFAANIESALPVTDLRLILVASRKPQSVLRTFFFSGVADGHGPCFVKYMPDNRACMENEWKMTRAFHEADARHCAAPLHFHAGTDGTAVLVSERLAGRELSSVLADGTVSADQAKDLAGQMQTISATLKKIRVCHRDVRPENLFLADDGCLKLIDFQFATPLDSPSEMAFAVEDWEKILLSLGEDFRARRGCWNDALSLAKCVAHLPDFPEKSETVAALEADAPGRYYAARFPKRMRRRFRVELLKMKFKNFRHRLTHRPPKNLDQIEFMQSVCEGTP